MALAQASSLASLVGAGVEREEGGEGWSRTELTDSRRALSVGMSGWMDERVN